MTVGEIALYVVLSITGLFILFCAVAWWSYKRTGRRFQEELTTLHDWYWKEYCELMQEVRAFYVCYHDPLHQTVIDNIEASNMDRALLITGQVADLKRYVDRWQQDWHRKWANRLFKFSEQLNHYLRPEKKISLHFSTNMDLFRHHRNQDSK